MHVGSLGQAAAEHDESEVDATPRLHQSPFRRSKLASNPLRGISTYSARGRQIHDTAARLLALLEHPTDELIIADVIALAELRVKADELRRDPNASPLDIVRLEGLVDRRTRRLGLDRRGKREPDSDRGLGQLLVDEHAQEGAPAAEAAGTRETSRERDVRAQDASESLNQARPAAGPETRIGDETHHRGEAVGGPGIDEPEDGAR
jgi:hypothetical protein